MTIRKISSDAIESGSITESLLHINVSNKVNAAYATANTANSAGSGGYDQANNAYAQANAAYSKANAAVTVAENAYAQANTARTTANDAYGQANSAFAAANARLSTSGGSISGDVAITGNLTVTGNATTMNVSNLSVNDSIILLSTNAVGDSNDIGFVGHFDRGATATHAGLIRKATQNQFYLFDNYEVEPTNNVIDVAGNNFRVGNLRLGIINANSFVTSAGLDVTGQANAAYGAANNRVLKAGDTMTGQLNISSGGLLVTGNVGIGTASPGLALDVNGAIRAASGTTAGVRVHVNSGITASGNYMNFFTSQTNGWAFNADSTGADVNTRAVISSTGSLGLGMTTPNAKIDIVQSGSSGGVGNTTGAGLGLTHSAGSGADAISLALRTTGTGTNSLTGSNFVSQIIASTTNANALEMYITGNSPLVLGTNATERMRITGAGNVGIGTANPSYRLHVLGNSLVQSSSGEIQLRLQSGTGQTYGLLNNPGWATNTLFLYDFSNDAHRLSITSTGNVGIGLTNPGQRLDVNGVTYSRGGIILGTSSSGWQFVRSRYVGQLLIRTYSKDITGGGVNSVVRDVCKFRHNYGWNGFYFAMRTYSTGYLGSTFRESMVNSHGDGTNIVGGAYSPFWKYVMSPMASFLDHTYTGTGPVGSVDNGYYEVTAKVTVGAYSGGYVEIDTDRDLGSASSGFGFIELL